MSAIYDKKSYLRNTPIRNGVLDQAVMPKISSLTGNYVQVPPECHNRIDLFAYQQYGSSRLWWLIALANADLIRDPLWDFTSGLTVLVPDQSIALSDSY